MIFKIHHTIEYTYSRHIFLEPQIIRMIPRSDAIQRVLRVDLRLDPVPSGRTDCVDTDGGVTVSAWFNDLREKLVITCDSTVETLRANPYDFIIIDQPTVAIPVLYSKPLTSALAPYLAAADPDGAIDHWADEALKNSGDETLGFILGVNQAIHERFEVIMREEGDPWSPAKTLAEGKGACRDLTVLFMEVLRRKGLACRFVTGYVSGEMEAVRENLHAWAEVFLPGGGWRGFDPTLGVAVADEHVSVCASPLPALAAPTTGAFRGTGASSEMTFHIEIEKLEKSIGR